MFQCQSVHCSHCLWQNCLNIARIVNAVQCSHLPRPVKSIEGNRSIKNFPRWWQATKYLEGNSSEFLSDRLVDVGAGSCQAEDGRLPRLPCVPPPASHPHKPESHQESHSCARCKYIGPCMVPVIAVVYFCLPVI